MSGFWTRDVRESARLRRLSPVPGAQVPEGSPSLLGLQPGSWQETRGEKRKPQAQPLWVAKTKALVT